MSVGAVSSISQVPYVYPTAAAVGMEEEFVVGASPLRTEGPAAAPPARQEIDAADAIQFSRDFPQLLMQQAFAVPVTETQAPAAVGGTGNILWQGDSQASAAGTELPVEESAGAAAPGEDGDGEETDEVGQGTNARGEPLSDEEEAQVEELSQRDREVRAHEQAHQAVGGQYAGGASYEYEQGPDGQRYAVGGEVSIDVSAESDPEATIAKMRQVRAAALAPAEPSSQDLSVAASAQQAEMQARVELRERQAEETAAATEEAAGADEAEEASGEGEEGEGVEGLAGDSGAGDATEDTGAGSVPSGGQTGAGVATLGSTAFRDAYVNRVGAAQSGYGVGAMTDPILSAAMGYRPIDIVA